MTDSQKISLADLFSLRGKTAIVTGGTGGIGLELSSTLAEAGAKIVSIQLPNDRASGALSSAIASKVEVYECDMTDSKALRATFTQMWKDDVVPDILLNCAGVNRRKAAVDFTDEEIDTVSSPYVFPYL
jgi:2-deoxy-D-gluconate 3-dehydrogenase